MGNECEICGEDMDLKETRQCEVCRRTLCSSHFDVMGWCEACLKAEEEASEDIDKEVP